jgi:membrane-associated phospholipid phosphatase
MLRVRYLLSICIIFGLVGASSGQVRDTLHRKSILRQSILPGALMGAGLLVNGSSMEKNLQVYLSGVAGDDFKSYVDDYLPFVPIAQLYIADLAGVKSRNHWFDQSKYLFISGLITVTLSHGLKKWTMKTRPDGAPYSFPSRHTSFAFNNAAVLYHEFNQTAPLLAYSGFAFATTTGVLRMINNEHWFSDVLFGAGLGVLVVELVYYFEPFKAINPFKNSSSIAVIPEITAQSYGFYFSYSF